MALTSSYSEAKLVGPFAVAGNPNEVHDSALNSVGAVAFDQFGNEYVYLKGVASTVEGDAVTFDEEGVTTLLAANAVGPVAWATAAIVANKYGWYARRGNLLGNVVTATSADSTVGRETTDGKVGDGRAAGDQIYGVVCREANASGSTALKKLQVYAYPHVDNIYGS